MGIREKQYGEKSENFLLFLNSKEQRKMALVEWLKSLSLVWVPKGFVWLLLADWCCQLRIMSVYY